jgi:hypothetical protein
MHTRKLLETEALMSPLCGQQAKTGKNQPLPREDQYLNEPIIGLPSHPLAPVADLAKLPPSAGLILHSSILFIPLGS